MIKNYKKGRSYAYKLDYENYQDNLHDAFLRHYDKTGENLFERPTLFVIRAIKWASIYNNRKNRTKKYGKWQRRITPFSQMPEGFDHYYTPENNELFKNFPSLIDVKVRNRTKGWKSESETSNRELIIERLKKILALKIEGFKNNEISSKLGISKQLVSKDLSLLKEIAYENI